ncbi:hypothetical protein AYY18_02240 [Morganella psychrotolerans]|uniref:Integrase catalytic domain-containing protein n=1 Tax=Morganella psychrotolerans TaxID=368603 RepID=A0A1B8HV17_9GAMM|nr:hypothetical protein AYY18_02240 [Morganella psychrotolerans]
MNYIQPGKLQKNAYIERFNGSFRHKFLNACLFESLSQIKKCPDSGCWMLDAGCWIITRTGHMKA